MGWVGMDGALLDSLLSAAVVVCQTFYIGFRQLRNWGDKLRGSEAGYEKRGPGLGIGRAAQGARVQGIEAQDLPGTGFMSFTRQHHSNYYFTTTNTT